MSDAAKIVGEMRKRAATKNQQRARHAAGCARRTYEREHAKSSTFWQRQAARLAEEARKSYDAWRGEASQ